MLQQPMSITAPTAARIKKSGCCTDPTAASRSGTKRIVHSVFDSGYAASRSPAIASISDCAAIKSTSSRSLPTTRRKWKRRTLMFSPPNGSGCHRSGAPKKSDPGGNTPTMIVGSSSTRNSLPITAGSAPKRRFQNPSLITATLGPPSTVSSRLNPRPFAGETPIASKNWCDAVRHPVYVHPVANDQSGITVSLQEAPSGKPMLYVPLPGGQVSFHIAYDQPTRLFWMISSQATDSMKRVELLGPKRYSMPNQERHRMVLHFSRNCIDWCFAGVVAQVDDVGQSHHGGNMVIDGDDLHILMRTANAAAKNAHNSNVISFHTVKGFRGLVY